MNSSSLDLTNSQQSDALSRIAAWASHRFRNHESPIVDAQYLRQLPKGTFGRQWIDTMDAAGLMPFSSGSRRQQLHDGIHVLAGYQTDPLGEVEVQAFLTGSKFRALQGIMLSQMVVTVALVKPMAFRVGHRFGLPTVLKHVVAAYRRGKKAQIDLDQWQPEQVWELPCVDVQAMFGLS